MLGSANVVKSLYVLTEGKEDIVATSIVLLYGVGVYFSHFLHISCVIDARTKTMSLLDVS